MTNTHDEQTHLAAERAALRAICQGAEGTPLWEEGLRLLASYRFRDATHQLVFDVLRQICSGRPEVIREHLQRRLVLAGFPDMNAQEFLEPHGLSLAQAHELVQRLAQSAQGPSP